MDPLTYIRDALALLRERTYRTCFIRIPPAEETVEIGYFGSDGEYTEASSAPDLPSLAAKIPVLLAKYGIDYPELS